MRSLSLALLVLIAALASIQEAEAGLVFDRPRIVRPVSAPTPRRASIRAVAPSAPAPTLATFVSSGGSCAVGSKSCR